MVAAVSRRHSAEVAYSVLVTYYYDAADRTRSLLATLKTSSDSKLDADVARNASWSASMNKLRKLSKSHFVRRSHDVLSAFFTVKAAKARGLRETAWLDGLRGVASFQVFIFHSSEDWGLTGERHLRNGYGSNEVTRDWWRLPFIRLVYSSGCLMVTIFFIISGFVLTQNGLRQIRNMEHRKLISNISSAAFRRILRIWLPVLVISFMTFSLVRFGLGSEAKRHRLKLQPTYIDQVVHWAREMNKVMNPFPYRDRSAQTWTFYAKSSWTLPLEVYGSFICYLLLVIMARMSLLRARLATLAFVSLWACYNHGWFIFLFVYGVALADYDLEIKMQRPGYAVQRKHWVRRLQTTFWTSLLVLGLYIAGWPESYEPFKNHTIRGVWLISFAACCIITAIYHLPWVRSLFETPSSQYLGRISFGLYLVQFPLLDLILEPYVRPWFRNFLGESKFLLFLTVFLFDVVVVILGGQIFACTVDAQSVKAAKYLETCIFDSVEHAVKTGETVDAEILPMQEGEKPRS